MKLLSDYIEDASKWEGRKSQFIENIVRQSPPKGFWFMPNGDQVFCYRVPNRFQKLVANKVLGMRWCDL